MAQQLSLELVLKAFDRTGSAFNALQAKFKGLESAGRAVDNVGKGIGASVAGGMVVAQAAIAATQAAFSGLSNTFSSAVDAQTQAFGAVSGLAGTFDMSFSAATESIDRMNATMVKAAKTLPGAAGDYSRIATGLADEIGAAFTDASGKITNMKAFEEATTKIGMYYGAIGAISKSSSQETTMALSRALSGGSFASLNELSFFMNNKALLNDLKKRTGGRELGELSAQERLSVLSVSGMQRAGSEDFLKNSGELFESKFSTLISDMFDPQFGVFGFLRDLDPGKGKASVLGALTGTFDRIFGESGIFGSLGKAFAGANFDPMKALFDGIGVANRIIDAVLLPGIRAVTPAIQGIVAKISPVVAGIGRTIEQGLQFLESGGSIGDLFRLIPTWIGDKIAALQQSIFGQMNAGNLFAVVGAVRGFLGSLASGIAGAINFAYDSMSRVFQTVDFTEVGLAVGIMFADLAIAIIDTLSKVDWFEVVVALLQTSLNIVNFAVGLVAGLGARLIEALFGLIEGAAGQLAAATGSAVSGFFAWLEGRLWAAIDSAKAMGGAAIRSIPLVGDALGNAVGLGAQAKWKGDFPDFSSIAAISASGGLLGAILDELRNKPPGADLVIANSSELVATPNQFRGIIGAAANSRSSVIHNTNNFYIASNNADEVAKRVLEMLDNLSASASATMLDAGYMY
jgi:hypothetical protein